MTIQNILILQIDSCQQHLKVNSITQISVEQVQACNLYSKTVSFITDFQYQEDLIQYLAESFHILFTFCMEEFSILYFIFSLQFNLKNFKLVLLFAAFWSILFPTLLRSIQLQTSIVCFIRLSYEHQFQSVPTKLKGTCEYMTS